MEHAVYRIIDANFNRAREALRVIEEFCRFALDSEQLTSRAKQLRHELCKAEAKIDSGKLLANRDTPGDIGCELEVPNQFKRKNLQDCVVAAFKRLTESLRSLAEAVHIINSDVAQTFEKLRYEVYTLEKDVLLFGFAADKYKLVCLYVILTGELPVDIIRLARSCASGGADCIQLRVKGLPDSRFLALAKEVVFICREAGIISIINDRFDIASAAGADGVHLGNEDIPLAVARKSQLRPMIFGRTAHSLSELQQAIDDRADYISIGPVFSTPTKPAITPLGLEYVKKSLRLLDGTGVGHAAIGGITPANLDLVLEAGVKTIAVCSAISDSPDPKGICRKLKDNLLSHQKMC